MTYTMLASRRTLVYFTTTLCFSLAAMSGCASANAPPARASRTIAPADFVIASAQPAAIVTPPLAETDAPPISAPQPMPARPIDLTGPIAAREGLDDVEVQVGTPEEAIGNS